MPSVPTPALRVLRGAALAVGLLVTGPALAQQLPPPPADAAQLQQELAEIQQRLAAAEQKVMQDPAVQTLQSELQEKVETAAKAADPGFDDKVERLGELQSTIQQAQQTGDQGKMQEALAEGQQLQQQLQATQAEVLEAPALKSEVERFQTKVRAKMVEVEPETEKLVARFDELVSKLQGGQAPPR